MNLSITLLWLLLVNHILLYVILEGTAKNITKNIGSESEKFGETLP